MRTLWLKLKGALFYVIILKTVIHILQMQSANPLCTIGMPEIPFPIPDSDREYHRIRLMGTFKAGSLPEQEKKRSGESERKLKGCHPRNYSWSELMLRVFEWDIFRCECGNRMRILCAINPSDAIRKILDCLGLPSRPPPIFPAVEESLFEF